MATKKPKIPVGILGATGTVGQKFIELLDNHPWFEVRCVAASRRSSGKPFDEAVKNRWHSQKPVPRHLCSMIVLDVEADAHKIADQTIFVFSALGMKRDKIKEIETLYAGMDTPVVSNNSAHRLTEDVPMIIPEINPHHSALINIQKKNRGWKKGFIVVKPNCSIQSYVPVLTSLQVFEPERIIISTYQSVSGAGKTMETWPEMRDNVMPFIPNEEIKSEMEPLKIWGSIKNGKLKLAEIPLISCTCIRVPVSDGHMVSVNAAFKNRPSRQEFIDAVNNYNNPIEELALPSSPKHFLKYFKEENRPQTAMDRTLENGMGIGVGRLREDTILQWKFVALSHNTIRGAAGGAILTAELLTKKGYIEHP